MTRRANTTDADVATLDKLLSAHIPFGSRHYLEDLQAAVRRQPAGLAPCQRRHIRYLARRFLNCDGTPFDATAVNASWLDFIDAVLATQPPQIVRDDLALMRDLIADRPEQPIPETWPGRIAEYAWSAGLVRGCA